MLLSFISIFSSGSLFTTPGLKIPEKIQKVFHQEFPDIENPVFHQSGDTYSVYFKNGNNSSERVYYNSDAEMVETVKYYTQNELEPFIRGKVYRKYKGKTIFNVTEVQSNTEHFYEIILQGNKTWYDVKSDAKGLIEIQKRWNGHLIN